jgi:lysozyme family protein
MQDNYPRSLTEVLKHEGGYVNDPLDPGGATNKGITQAIYDDWRADEGLVKRSVKYINDYEVGKIYKNQYWDACHCDGLPSGVDYAVFDFAVNSGVKRAIRYLQQVVSVSQDGQVGPMTIQAINTIGAREVVTALCAARLKFLQLLPTFPRFGNGWTQRITDVAVLGREMADEPIS